MVRLIAVLVIIILTSCNNVRRDYFDSGELKAEIPIVNDAIEGEAVLYYKDGTIKEKAKWVKGKRHGLTQKFSENGVVYLEIMYENDVKNGEVREYYPNKNIKRKASFSSGLLLGDFKSFYENGQIFRKGQYLKNGLEFRSYYESGEHKEYHFKALINEDTVFYYKKYSKEGLIQEFALPYQVVESDQEYCFKLQHTFIPDEELEISFYASDASDIREAMKSEIKFSTNQKELCVSKKSLPTRKPLGFFVEKAKSHPEPMGYRKIPD